MTPEEAKGYIPRKNVLTEADLAQLAILLSQHPCKFQVSHEQMDDIVRVSKFFKKFEEKVISGVQWVFLVVIAGFFWILYNHGYFTGK